MGALAACAAAGPDALKDAAQLALGECTDDVCQGAAARWLGSAWAARAARVDAGQVGGSAGGPSPAPPSLPPSLSPCTAIGLATAVAALDRADRRRLAAATAAYERSGGEEEAQLLFDARAALVRLYALLAVGGAASAAAAHEDEVYDGLHRLLEVSGCTGPCAGAGLDVPVCALFAGLQRVEHVCAR